MAAREAAVVYMDVETNDCLSDDSTREDAVVAIVPVPNRRHRRIGALFMVFSSLGVVLLYSGARTYFHGRSVSGMTGDESDSHTQQNMPPRLYETDEKHDGHASAKQSVTDKKESKRDGSMTVAEFVTSRRLGKVAAPALDVKCPLFQPSCDLDDHFVSLMHQQTKILKSADPKMADQFRDTKISAAEQELMLAVLPLVRDNTVLRIGQMIATTVKRFAKKGEKVVHKKVTEVLANYSKQHGSVGVPPVNTSKAEDADPSIWTALMNPKMLAVIGDGKDKDKAPVANRRLRLDAMILGTNLLGTELLLRLVLLIFQILNKTKTLLLPTWLKLIIMWGNLVGGALICVATLLLGCPFVFLEYWLNAWLLYSNDLPQLAADHIPFWKLLQKLPGLRPNITGGRRLLAMDPRFAA